MAYAVVRTDNLTGTFDGSKLRSVIYHVDTTPTAIENGNVVLLDSRMTGATQRDVWKAVAPAGTFEAGKIALVASPEIMYEAGKVRLDEFRNEAGDIARAYVLEAGDQFSVTAEAFAEAAPEIGGAVGLGNTTKLAAAESGFAVCTGIEVVGTKTFYVITVVGATISAGENAGEGENA